VPRSPGDDSARPRRQGGRCHASTATDGVCTPGVDGVRRRSVRRGGIDVDGFGEHQLGGVPRAEPAAGAAVSASHRSGQSGACPGSSKNSTGTWSGSGSRPLP
jgi:hypothetical protein